MIRRQIVIVFMVLSAMSLTSALSEDRSMLTKGRSDGSGDGDKDGISTREPGDSIPRRYPEGYPRGYPRGYTRGYPRDGIQRRYGGQGPAATRRRLGKAQNGTALGGQPSRHGQGRFNPSQYRAGRPNGGIVGRQGDVIGRQQDYNRRQAYTGRLYGQTQRSARGDATRTQYSGGAPTEGAIYGRQRQGRPDAATQVTEYPRGGAPQRNINNRRMDGRNGRRYPGAGQGLVRNRNGQVNPAAIPDASNGRRQPVRGQRLRNDPDGVRSSRQYDVPPGVKIPGDFKIPEGMQLPDGFKIPEGIQIPEGYKLPKGMKLPEGVKLPDGFQIPDKQVNAGAPPSEDAKTTEDQAKPLINNPPSSAATSKPNGDPDGKTHTDSRMPPQAKLPEGLKIPKGFKIPENFELPEGFEIPEGLEIPDDFQIPEGFKIPEGVKIPEGFEIPPSMKGVLAGMTNLKSMNVAGQDDMLANLPNNSAVGMVGLPLLLRCSFDPDSSGSVVWVGPDGVEIITYNYDVLLESQAARIQVVGNGLPGSYDLLLKSVQYPEDNGTWTCKQIGGDQLQTTVIVIVPPATRYPDVTPSNGTVSATDRPWTFSCVGQFAHPPVTLTWVKLTGPDADFIQTLPQHTTSRTQGVATTVNLIVGPQNAGSTFSCQARHPTFKDKVYTVNVTYGAPQFSALVQENKQTSLTLSAVSMDANDMAMLVVVTTVAIVAIIILLSLYKGRAGWELDVRPRIDYIRVPTTDVETGTEKLNNGNHSNCKDNHANNVTVPQDTGVEVIANGSLKERYPRTRNAVPKSVQRRCVVKAVFGAIFSILLLLSLGLAIPLYLKGVTPPKLGTDTMTSVVAGSSLWLDCSALAQPIDSVLEVTWYRDANKFYHQSHVTGSNVGYPHNGTHGMSMGTRVTSNWFGQINIWPVLPGEQGVYSCQVTSAVNHFGETIVKTKSFGVFVITGIFINKALLAVLGIALGSAVCLIAVGLYHSLRCTRSRCTGGT